eukprot:scaffold55551_cov29-Tisochrysis_lutea.AAC.5
MVGLSCRSRKLCTCTGCSDRHNSPLCTTARTAPQLSRPRARRSTCKRSTLCICTVGSALPTPQQCRSPGSRARRARRRASSRIPLGRVRSEKWRRGARPVGLL